MTLAVEIIILCALFSVIIIAGTKKNPLGGLHNLPKAVQERAAALPEYQSKNLQVVSAKRRILKKLPALVLLVFIFCAMICGAGAGTFLQGFLYTFILWTSVKLFVTLVLNCGWYAHTPSVWIKGTEDMKVEYQNYKFYLSSIPRSLAAGVVVSALVGFVIILHLYRMWNIEELTPAMCRLDYDMAAANNTEFIREQTLAGGGKFCDCHYIHTPKR